MTMQIIKNDIPEQHSSRAACTDISNITYAESAYKCAPVDIYWLTSSIWRETTDLYRIEPIKQHRNVTNGSKTCSQYREALLHKFADSITSVKALFDKN